MHLDDGLVEPFACDLALDGDLALIKPQSSAENGDIVVAMRNEEATLKRFFREDGKIVLKPKNSSMQPIIINEGEAEIEKNLESYKRS